MKIKCDYCSNTYEDTLPKCPDCGAPNPTQKSVSHRDPKTIEELRSWYKARNLPPSNVTRFYIGVDYQGPKAFGIYEDENGDFVVYKNKADGTRAIRYKGKDEAYAVNELLQRLKEEIVHQKNNPSKLLSSSVTNHIHTVSLMIICLTLFLVLVNIVHIWNAFSYRFGDGLHDGYYECNHDTYYLSDGSWYVYGVDPDTLDNDWLYVDTYSNNKYNQDARTIENNYDDYYISRNWNSSIDATDWKSSSYYDDYHSGYSDWSSDSDYDWGGSDSWDSGGTDWDSDW